MENKTLKIRSALAAFPTIDYRTLNAFQGDLKELKEVEYRKLKLNLFGDEGIPQNEFFVPLMVWVEPKTKKPYILDGHQRINVIKSCNGEPYELPYFEIEAKNKVEAKKKLALVNSQYGRITRDGWDGFMHDVDVDWLRGMTTLEAFTLPPIEGFGKDFEPSGKPSGEGTYSEEIDYSILDDFEGSDGLDARLDEALRRSLSAYKVLARAENVHRRVFGRKIKRRKKQAVNENTTIRNRRYKVFAPRRFF